MGRLIWIAALATALTAMHLSAASASVYFLGNSRGDQLLLHQVLGQHHRPFFAGLRSPSAGFAPFTPISEPVDISQRSAVIDGGGGAVVAWTTGAQDPNPSPGRLFVAIRRPGDSFASPVQLASDGTMVWLYGNGRGDTIVVWYTQAGEARYSFRPASGDFGPTQAIDKPPVGIAIEGDGTAVAVFSGSSHFELATRPVGADFGPRQPIAGTDGARLGTFAAAPDGRGLLVWTDGPSVFTMDRPAGGDFGPPVRVGARADYDLSGAVVRQSGAALIRFGNLGQAAALRPPGGRFSRMTPIAVPYGGQTDLDVNDDGDAAVAWRDYEQRVHARYYTPGSGWSNPVTVAPAPAFSTIFENSPGVALPASGDATVVWEQTNGTRVRTYARRLRGRNLGRIRLLDSIPTYVRQGPPAACRPKGTRLLASNATATLYREHGQIFGCFLASGAPLQLWMGEFAFAAHTISLAGPLVASGYDDDPDGRSGLESTLVVTDLRDPEFGINRGTLMEPDAYPATAVLLATRLRPNGAVAWLSCPDESETRALAKECRRLGGVKKHLFVWPSRAEEPRLVDSSRWIDRRMLKLRGSLLTWRDRGKLRHARLR